MSKLNLKTLKELYIPYEVGEHVDWNSLIPCYNSIPELIDALEDAHRLIKQAGWYEEFRDEDYYEKQSNWLERFEDE